MREFRIIAFCMAPALILLLFLVVAVGWSLHASFTDISLVGRAARSPEFVGLRNYARIFRDLSFLNSLKISFIFTIGSALIGQALLGLSLAVLLKQKGIKFKTTVAAAVILCWIIPDMVAVYVWGAFTAYGGMLNTILGIFRLPAIRWLGKMPLETVIIANIWRGTAFSMILFSSALETVSPTLYEAADVDGASSWQKFKSITLPLITPVILVDLILITMWTFGHFSLVYGLTGGGPGRLTEVLPVFIYNQSFRHYEIGYGAALSFIMFIIVGSVSLIYFRLLQKAERMSIK